MSLDFEKLFVFVGVVVVVVGGYVFELVGW